MIALDVVFWALLLLGEVPMPGMKWLMMEAKIPMTAPGAMELGVFHIGTANAVFEYVVMRGIMMWAMMYPAMTRFTREYARALRGTSFTVALAVLAFLCTYSLVWAASATIPLGFHAVLRVEFTDLRRRIPISSLAVCWS